jgi:hypothetical protein
VDTLSTTDAWAVGRFQQNTVKHPLVQHWDGAEWTIVPTPDVEESELLGVAAVAADDVWMVGGYENTGEALIMHWDGSSISVMPHPIPGVLDRLYAVTAVSTDDVWAVGSSGYGTLALHWDGSQWTRVPTPGGGTLLGVAAAASDDVWAVGETTGGYTLALHWNGSTWSHVPTPTPGSYAWLKGVSASSSKNVWAVGDGIEGTLTMRWTGSEWEVIPSPDPGNDRSSIDVRGVVANAPSDVWAVGYYDVFGDHRTLTMHWNGSEWTIVESPEPGASLNQLNGVAAPRNSSVSKRDVWAVGWGGSTGTLALRWRGDKWAIVLTPNVGTGNNVLNGISAAAPDDIWAVGHAQFRSLTLHYDGSDWRIVPSPNLQSGVRLEDVVALDADDAWAVGWSGSGGDPDDRNVAMHWDGQDWSIVPTPQPGGIDVDQLRAVDAVGPNDVWAVGRYLDSNLNYRSLILHWDGGSWTVVQHTCDVVYGLNGITVLSPSNIWAVGDSTTCHYNGTTWTEVPSPQPRSEYREIGYPLEDVSGASPDDVWAVGARVIEYFKGVVFVGFAEHWNGTQWTRVLDVPGQFLYGVEALASNDVWAVGTDGSGPLIAHYDGTSWSTAPTPEAGRGGRLGGIDRAGSELWAGGNFYPTTEGSRTLILRAPSDREGAVVGSTNVAGATITWFGPERGSTSTDNFGDYQVGGLLAGTYDFIASEPGCVPESAAVTVTAGVIVRQDFQLEC